MDNIVRSKLLKRHSKAKRRAPVYSRALSLFTLKAKAVLRLDADCCNAGVCQKTRGILSIHGHKEEVYYTSRYMVVQMMT